MSIKLYRDDCLAVMKNLPDKSVDLIVTDCPYHIVSGGCTNVPRKDETSGILNKRNTFTQKNAKSGKLFDNNDIEFEQWLPDVYRVLKDSSHCYIMINARNLKNLQTQAEKVGFIFQQLLVWDKGNVTPNKYYMNGCEFILMLRKGKAKNINNVGTKNILSIPNIRGKLHPTEKPIDLMQILIENSTAPGDTVLDPFMGCGSTGIACVKINRDFIGIEIDDEYYNIAKKRIGEYSVEITESGEQTRLEWLHSLLGGVI